MADTLDVLTLNEAKAAVNIQTTNVDFDAELEQQVTAVSRMIDAACGPVVQRTITAELHDGNTTVIWPRYTPVASVTLVRSASGGTITTVTAVAFGGTGDGYTLTGNRLTHSSGRWTGSQVELTYVAGRYATTAAVDARFKTCAASVLRRLWKRESGTWAQSSNFFETTDTVQSGSGFFRVAKPIIDEMLLDELVLPGVA